MSALCTTFVDKYQSIMKKIYTLIITTAFCFSLHAEDHTKYVNPFIGTQTDETGALSGSTFPGACVPLGLIQLCPEHEQYVTWDPCCGYDYNKNRIYGFTHTHLSGTGCTDLIDISLMPVANEVSKEQLAKGDFSQTMNHADEGATPGYYWVKLQESGIKVETSATEHAGIHHYTFPTKANQQIVIDLDRSTYRGDDAYYVVEGQRNYQVLMGQLRIVNDHTIEGYRIITGWAKIRKIYFHAEFSKPFTKTLMMDGNRSVESGKIVNGTALRAALSFNGNDANLTAKVALSAVDYDGARKNFEAECKGWDFNTYKKMAHDKWEKALAKIDVQGSDVDKTIFYTGMYHTMIQPNVMSDVDGRYINTNFETKRMPNGKKYYSTFSLWDTFRAAHPLYNLLIPNIAADLVNAMVLHQQSYGYLPIWDLWGQDNYCMIGNHAIPVLSRAILTDIPGIDQEAAYKAMVESSTLSHRNSPFEVWEQYGYMPSNILPQSVSITLEMAFNDWCVAAVAEKLGHKDDAARFYRRAKNYRNMFDSSIGFFAPKDDKGEWMRPFDPLSYSSNGFDGQPFTEGNAWQYLWFVPQDPEGLIELFGGKNATISKLNENFTLTSMPGDHNENASGFIGQYAHGNEPSHHTAYLYNFCGQPWRTQEIINEVRQKFYNDKPYGYAGNDDCGQMSAWYIFSSMGFYPFNAGADDFVIGTPLFTETTIHLANGKDFAIKAPRKNDKAIYVKSVTLNGKPIKDLRITQKQIEEGGVLEFKMSDKKSK